MTARIAATPVVTRMASTKAVFAGARRNCPAWPSCAATAWVAVIDEPAALRAPADSAFVDAMRITTAIAAALAVVGAFAVLRWLPGRKRPTIEELVAEEIAAAERELQAVAPNRQELSER